MYKDMQVCTFIVKCPDGVLNFIDHGDVKSVLLINFEKLNGVRSINSNKL